MSELMEDIKKIEIFNQRLGDYLAGYEHGKTMAELDDQCKGLLKEVEELEDSLEE
jgi:hypothetical protein